MKTITPHSDMCKTLVIERDADVKASDLELLAKADPLFMPAYKRKRRAKDNSASTCEAIVAEHAVRAEWDDQKICNLIIGHKNCHDDFVSDPGYYARAITKARAADERAQLLSAISAGKTLTREEALQRLSSLLTVEVTSIQRFKTDPRSYVMRLSNDSYIEFKNHSELTSQKRLAGALFDYARTRMPRFKNQEWGNVEQCMLDAIEDVESSFESTHLGATITHLRSYLLRHLRPELSHEGQKRSMMDGKPAILDGHIWFSTDGLKRSILMDSSEQPPAKEILSVRLKQIGCEYAPHKSLRPSGESNTSRSRWCAPTDFLSEQELESLITKHIRDES